MKITFSHVDDEYYGTKEYIVPIVNVAIKYDDFVRLLCEILNTFDKYTERIVNDVKKTLDLYRQCYEDDMSENQKQDYFTFSESVYNFYWNIVDDEFGKRARSYNEDLYIKSGLRYADNRLGRYRGLLFEELVCATVKDRFSDSNFASGCRIYVNGVRVIARYGEGNSNHKETIDIAGWNEVACYGEFYECKINPVRFEIPNYKYFIEVKKVLESNNVTQYILALVSADSKEHIKAQKQYIESIDEECNIEFDIIGRENIHSILDYKIPEIA